MKEDHPHPLKVILAGSRSITAPSAVPSAVSASGFAFRIGSVITGGASGVDSLAVAWAAENGIPVALYLPDWRKYGRAAGPIRNRLMASHADALIAIMSRRRKTPGTLSMIREAQKKGLQIYVHYLD